MNGEEKPPEKKAKGRDIGGSHLYGWRGQCSAP